MGELFTIGHSHHQIPFFLDVLHKYNVNYLMDVRSVPYSRYAEQFNRENIQKDLGSAGINYVFMGKYFGARQDNPSLYNDEGYLDFETVRTHSPFVMRVDSVIKGLNQGNNIALMCTEKEPIDCHRAILVARAFEQRGIQVKHILPSGNILTQDALNEQLLDLYFPDRNTISLFATVPEATDEEMLSEAYRLRNKAIGYRIGSEKAKAM